MDDDSDNRAYRASLRRRREAQLCRLLCCGVSVAVAVIAAIVALALLLAGRYDVRDDADGRRPAACAAAQSDGRHRLSDARHAGKVRGAAASSMARAYLGTMREFQRARDSARVSSSCAATRAGRLDPLERGC